MGLYERANGRARSAASYGLKGDEVTLRWEWQGEVAAARYLIERAVDGDSFGDWREVTAQGARAYQLNEAPQLTLQVQTDPNLPVQVALYNLNGRLQRRFKLTGGAQRSQRVDLRDLPAGGYLLHCQDGRTRHTQRVMLR